MTKYEFMEKIVLIKELSEQIQRELCAIDFNRLRENEEFWYYVNLNNLSEKAGKTLYTARKIFDRLYLYADEFEKNHKK